MELPKRFILINFNSIYFKILITSKILWGLTYKNLWRTFGEPLEPGNIHFPASTFETFGVPLGGSEFWHAEREMTRSQETSFIYRLRPAIIPSAGRSCMLLLSAARAWLAYCMFMAWIFDYSAIFISRSKIATSKNLVWRARAILIFILAFRIPILNF